MNIVIPECFKATSSFTLTHVKFDALRLQAANREVFNVLWWVVTCWTWKLLDEAVSFPSAAEHEQEFLCVTQQKALGRRGKRCSEVKLASYVELIWASHLFWTGVLVRRTAWFVSSVCGGLWRGARLIYCSFLFCSCEKLTPKWFLTRVNLFLEL